MTVRFETLLAEVLSLPASERRDLAAALRDSLEVADEASVADAWRRELQRRRAALRSGTAVTIPWTEAKARLRAL